jgi:hypothetical protein
MPRVDAGRKRCAIYTRKSSEEGLEQEFNSLAAQREACEAFIRSQQLCAQVNLLQLVLASAEPLAPLGARGPRRPGIRGNRRANPGVDRSGRRSWGVDNAVGVEHRRHRQRRAHPTTPRPLSPSAATARSGPLRLSTQPVHSA